MPINVLLSQTGSLGLYHRIEKRGDTYEVRYPGILNQRYATLAAAQAAYDQAVRALASAPLTGRGYIGGGANRQRLLGVSFFDARRALNTIPGATTGAGGTVSTLPGSIDAANAAARSSSSSTPWGRIAAAALALFLLGGRRA